MQDVTPLQTEEETSPVALAEVQAVDEAPVAGPSSMIVFEAVTMARVGDRGRVMVTGGVEVMISVLQEEVVGPLVLFGHSLGGLTIPGVAVSRRGAAPSRVVTKMSVLPSRSQSGLKTICRKFGDPISSSPSIVHFKFTGSLLSKILPWRAFSSSKTSRACTCTSAWRSRAPRRS